MPNSFDEFSTGCSETEQCQGTAWRTVQRLRAITRELFQLSRLAMQTDSRPLIGWRLLAVALFKTIESLERLMGIQIANRFGTFWGRLWNI